MEEMKLGRLCAVWEHQIKESENLGELEKAITYLHILDIYDKQIAVFNSVDAALDYIDYLNTTAKENIFYYVTT